MQVYQEQLEQDCETWTQLSQNSGAGKEPESLLRNSSDLEEIIVAEQLPPDDRLNYILHRLSSVVQRGQNAVYLNRESLAEQINCARR